VSVGQVDLSHPDCGSLGDFIFLCVRRRHFDVAEAVDVRSQFSAPGVLGAYGGIGILTDFLRPHACPGFHTSWRPLNLHHDAH